MALSDRGRFQTCPYTAVANGYHNSIPNPYPSTFVISCAISEIQYTVK